MERNEVRIVTKLKIPIAVVAIAMVIYHLISTQYLVVSSLEHQNIHLGFTLIFVFLFAMQGYKKRLWPLFLLATFIVFSVIAIGYIHIFHDELIERIGFPISSDVFIGTILVILVLEGTRRAFGIVLPLISLIFVLYTAFGYLLPAPFYTKQYSFSILVSKFSMLGGLYGTILGISADYLFLFMVFGAVLEISGANTFFTEVGKLVSGKLAGGAALASIVSSGMLGSLTGSVSANVAMVGSYSIPLMKRVGYKAENAAAIQAAASTGEQFPPPIMGAAAFMMAAITGIPYFRIMMAAAIPALLYYLPLGVYAQLQAMKMGIKPIHAKIDVKGMLHTSHLFLVPVGIIIGLLCSGFSPSYTIFWTIVSLVVLSLLCKEGRPTLGQWVEGLIAGAKLGAELGVTCALLGLVLTSCTLTGLGLKLPGVVESLSGGNMAIALILTALVALILGCGLPSTAVYILVAIAAVPCLLRMGLPLLSAHFFAFYFGVMSFITPPVAIGALVAAKLAGANFFRTGLEAIKAALGGFIVPFLIICMPVFLLEPQEGTILGIVVGIIASVVILTAIEFALCNHYLLPLNIAERLILIISAAMLFGFLITKSYIFILGFVPFIFVTLWQLRKRGKA